MVNAAPKSDYSSDVIIVGAGLAGLALGHILAKADLRVVILGPSERIGAGRTVALLDPSMRRLAEIGVADAVERVGAPLRRLKLIDDCGTLLRAPTLDFRAEELGLAQFGWNIETAVLADLLEGALAQHPSIRRMPTAAQRFSFDASSATVETTQGERLTASLVVGADGRQSPTRRAAAIDERAMDYAQIALTGVFSHRRAHDDASIEFHKRGGPFTLVPLPAKAAAAHRSSLVWAMPAREAEAVLALNDADWALRVEREAHAYFGAMRFEAGRGRFPIWRVEATRLCGARVALVGEAAHALPPIGAQGFNLSLRDAGALGEIVGAARAKGDDIGSSETLAGYEAARMGDVRLRAAVVDALNRSLLADIAPFDAARASVLAGLSFLPPLRHAALKIGLGAR